MIDVLDRLRSNGWMVAVHNDYRQDGKFMTFWLLTHPDGTWIKGEAATDRQALEEAESQLSERHKVRQDETVERQRGYNDALAGHSPALFGGSYMVGYRLGRAKIGQPMEYIPLPPFPKNSDLS